MNKQKNEVRELAAELDMMDNMITSLIEILEERGIITHEEWEKKIKRKIESRPSNSIRDIK